MTTEAFNSFSVVNDVQASDVALIYRLIGGLQNLKVPFTADTTSNITTLGTLAIANPATATGTITALKVTGAANTNQTAATEIPDASFVLNRTVQFATGALATQRAVKITAPTYGFVGSSTVTDAATLGITGAPIKGTNTTFTNTHTLLLGASAVVGATQSYGLTCNANTGGTKNYAAQFMGGNVGVGTATPTALVHIAAGTAAAGTAPLKLTSGTNLTTAEAGAFEYNGTNLFFTRAGTTREGVITQTAVTSETLVTDTSVTINIGGTTYKLCAKA